MLHPDEAFHCASENSGICFLVIAVDYSFSMYVHLNQFRRETPLV